MLPADARVQTRRSVLHTYNTPQRSRARYFKLSFFYPDPWPTDVVCLVGEEDAGGRRGRTQTLSVSRRFVGCHTGRCRTVSRPVLLRVDELRVGTRSGPL